MRRYKKLTNKLKIKIIESWLEHEIPFMDKEIQNSMSMDNWGIMITMLLQRDLMVFIRDELLTGNTVRTPEGYLDIRE